MKLIDLSHPVRDGQPAFPGDPVFRSFPHATIPREGCNVSRIEMGSHHGTHLDALRHFIADGRAIHEMPLEWFFGPAALLRVPKGPREDIVRDDFAPFEAALAPGVRIVLETGWHRRFGTTGYFTDFPSLTPGAAALLADRGIRMLGMDTPTPGRDFAEVHRLLQRRPAEIVIVESLANLHLLPPSFTFIGFPLRLEGGDGSPIRAVAVVE